MRPKENVQVLLLTESESPIDDDQTDLFSNWDNECAGICGV